MAFLVHADRPVHPVVEDDHHDRDVVLHRGRELRHGHEEVTVAREAHHPAVGVDEPRRDRSWKAVRHRAAQRGELRAVAPERPEPMRPDGEVARPVRQDGVVVDPLGEHGHDRSRVDRARQLAADEVVEELGVRLIHRSPGAARRIERRQAREDGREPRPGGDDPQLWCIDASELLGRRMDVDETATVPGGTMAVNPWVSMSPRRVPSTSSASAATSRSTSGACAASPRWPA